MGNCTSKKSRKSLQLSATKKPLSNHKMDKEQDSHAKGLSKKVAPFTKGEVTSFGFKKKLTSQLPVPVTLTSNGHPFHEIEEKKFQNGVINYKSLGDGYQSGSSVESLCHAPYRSTPKMLRRRDLMRQQVNNSPVANEAERELNSLNAKNNKAPIISATFHPVVSPAEESGIRNNGSSFKNNPSEVNRFGFRQPTPPRTGDGSGKNGLKTGSASVTRANFFSCQGPYETGSYATWKKPEVAARSRSEGPREAFFKQTIQPANSVQSGLNQSKLSLTSASQPGRFTLQTSHLPRPQFPVRMPDTKTAKTAANNYRKGGARNECYSSKEGSLNEDSGFESHPSANNTLEKNIEILDSSPGSKVRRRLPAYKGKKLEMKIVGNKFELMKKDEDNRPDVVTEVSVIKLPSSNVSRTSTTAIINTGLVEQRTNQYLKKIAESYNKKDVNDMGAKDPNRLPAKSKPAESDSNNGDEGLGAESEEEKLFKDSRKSEKSIEKYLMSDGCGEADDMLPGEAMAEDISLNLSFEEETSTGCSSEKYPRVAVNSEMDVTPNTIRLDALKLSKQLKYKNCPSSIGSSGNLHRKGEDTSLELLIDKDEETFPSDSMLEQLSSESDSLGDKGENKNNDKEKNLKILNLNLDKEDLGIEMDGEEDNNSSKSDTDLDENDLDLNGDETDLKDGQNNCLDTDSPDTPTHASNSLSLSEGRDFLIDDEIADQPQLCFSGTYLDCNYQEEVKICREKTVMVPPPQQNGFMVSEPKVKNPTEMSEEDENIVEEEDEEIVNPIVNGDVHGVGKMDLELDVHMLNGEGRHVRLNSEGTLSPCESIASDDLMLDFESNSFEETAGRFDIPNENISVESLNISTNGDGYLREVSSQRHNIGTGGGKLAKTREVGGGPATTRRPENTVSSPLRSSSRLTSTPEEDSVIVDKVSYQGIFQDIVSMKSMLLKLKRLLSESEGSLQENGRLCPEEGNVLEDELADLRRQVLFLQQQLEEREKTVQILKLEINKTTADSENGAGNADLRKQSNAATQTGLDQFQQDFPHFRIFQTTPVV